MIRYVTMWGITFVTLNGVKNQRTNEDRGFQTFQLSIDDKVANVEIISLANYICCVEFSGQEPIFITRIKENNKTGWISIPRGYNELAQVVGNYVDKQLRSKG